MVAMEIADARGLPGSLGASSQADGGERAHLWVEHQAVALPLLLFGFLTLASSWFANRFDPSDAFWFVAGPAGCWICAYLYRRQRRPGEQPAGPDGLYIRAGFILLAAQSLIVLLAVDAPLGIALTLVAIGLRLGSRYLAGWAAVFAVIAGVTRYAVFNRLAGQRPHHGPITPLTFALDGLILLAAGVVARRREAAWASEGLYPDAGSGSLGTEPGAEAAGGPGSASGR
jgi:hypothetical protein